MAEAHEVIDISIDEEDSYDGDITRIRMSVQVSEKYLIITLYHFCASEPEYTPTSPSDSIYNISRSDSGDYPG